jgi:hypothetical protein
MLPPPQANLMMTLNLSSVQIGTCFAFFDRFPSLKQRSDWHGRKMVEKCKASANLNAALSSGNARKTVEKRKASVNLNAALGANKIPPNITQMFRTSQPQLCLLDEGEGECLIDLYQSGF